MNNNFLTLSIIPIILLLLIPATLVFGQTNPWALFQQLCQGAAFATGPQCQNLGTSSSSSVCDTNAILQNGVCVPTTSSSSPLTAGNCPTNAILQNGVCVPVTTTQTSPVTPTQTSPGNCPPNYMPQNGVCVPVTTTQTSP
jgi:hypothetical protein